jgi:hypothetical protein
MHGPVPVPDFRQAKGGRWLTLLYKLVRWRVLLWEQ